MKKKLQIVVLSWTCFIVGYLYRYAIARIDDVGGESFMLALVSVVVLLILSVVVDDD